MKGAHKEIAKSKWTQAHKDYRKKVFEDVGVNYGFWSSFIRPMVRHIKGRICGKCNSKNNVDIHHSSLELINIHTLKMLCKTCHSHEHQKVYL